MEKKWFNIRDRKDRKQRYSIQAQWTEAGAVKSKTLKLEQVDVVNRNFASGLLTAEQAFEQMEQIRDSLYKDRDKDVPVPLFTDENLKALNAYWKEEYSDRDLETPGNMYYDLKRAVGYLQGLSIYTASREEIRDQYKMMLEENLKRHRRMIDRLNQLLRYVGRDFRLKKPKAETDEVTYLSLAQFRQFLTKVKNPIEVALYWTAFATGLRLGECFALRSEAVSGDLVKVAKQMLKKADKYREKLPKRGKRRTAMIIHKEAIPYVNKWAALPIEEKRSIREKDWAGKVYAIAADLFKDEVNHITFHGFRHSYAIHMLQSGVPLDAVSLNLGNTRAVCEKYYTGFVIREAGIEMVRNILNKKD